MCPAGREMAKAYGRAKSNSVPPSTLYSVGKTLVEGKCIFLQSITLFFLFVLVTVINASVYIKNILKYRFSFYERAKFEKIGPSLAHPV